MMARPSEKHKKTYGMSEHMLRDKQKKLSQGKSLDPEGGRKPALNVEIEAKLSQCIAVLCNLGFSATREEILNLVRDYLDGNHIHISVFKYNRPGYDWFKSFMGRNHLSLKKANMICTVCKGGAYSKGAFNKKRAFNRSFTVCYFCMNKYIVLVSHK